MKILQINSVCGYGSTGGIAIDIYKNLEDHGHECVIAYGRGYAPDRIKNIRIGSKFDNFMAFVQTRIFDNHGFSSIKATRDFIIKAEEFNPDVIHLHNIHGYYINIDLLFRYLKESGKPVIWTLHDCWAFTGHCAHFDYIGCTKWENRCQKCPQKRRYPKSIIVDNSKSNYEKKSKLFSSISNLTIVVPSDWLGRLTMKSFLKKSPTRIIYNGVDLSVFKNRISNFRSVYNIENKFVILGVASIWDNRKGLNYFLEIAYQMDDKCRIVLVGLDDAQLRRLPSNIIGIKRTNSKQELAEIYSSADVFVNPTLEEVLGLVNLEALACGTPVVTFNTGGSIECIDESCGLVALKENLEDLILKIQVVRNNGKESYSENCIRRVREFFNKDDRYNDYIEIYKEVSK